MKRLLIAMLCLSFQAYGMETTVDNNAAKQQADSAHVADPRPKLNPNQKSGSDLLAQVQVASAYASGKRKQRGKLPTPPKSPEESSEVNVSEIGKKRKEKQIKRDAEKLAKANAATAAQETQSSTEQPTSKQQETPKTEQAIPSAPEQQIPAAPITETQVSSVPAEIIPAQEATLPLSPIKKADTSFDGNTSLDTTNVSFENHIADIQKAFNAGTERAEILLSVAEGKLPISAVPAPIKGTEIKDAVSAVSPDLATAGVRNSVALLPVPDFSMLPPAEVPPLPVVTSATMPVQVPESTPVVAMASVVNPATVTSDMPVSTPVEVQVSVALQVQEQTSAVSIPVQSDKVQEIVSPSSPKKKLERQEDIVFKGSAANQADASIPTIAVAAAYQSSGPGDSQTPVIAQVQTQNTSEAVATAAVAIPASVSNDDMKKLEAAAKLAELRQNAGDGSSDKTTDEQPATADSQTATPAGDTPATPKPPVQPQVNDPKKDQPSTPKGNNQDANKKNDTGVWAKMSSWLSPRNTSTKVVLVVCGAGAMMGVGAKQMRALRIDTETEVEAREDLLAKMAEPEQAG